MRRSVFVPSAAAILLLAAVPVSADTTRSLKGSLTPAAGTAWAVENLAGTMHVVPGAGSDVVATVTVHAESDDVANLVRVETVQGEKGVPTLRVIYPVEKYSSYRYPGHGDESSSWGDWFGGGSHLDYAGHRVKVSRSSGILLYADLEVQVPARLGQGDLIDHVGALQAKGVEGTLKFDTASGDVALEDVKGTIKVDTGSGDVQATRGGGTLSCDTGSGDVTVDGFEGESFHGDVGSGDIRLRNSRIATIACDSGSGDLSAHAVEVQDFKGDTGSGDIFLEATGSALVRVVAKTGSGDVTLRLPADASFEARADQGSGDLSNRFADAQPIVKGREVIGYRRGDGRTRIDVETGSGDCTIEPGTASAAKR
jgi:Putative adhesin